MMTTAINVGKTGNALKPMSSPIGEAPERGACADPLQTAKNKRGNAQPALGGRNAASTDGENAGGMELEESINNKTSIAKTNKQWTTYEEADLLKCYYRVKSI